MGGLLSYVQLAHAQPDLGLASVGENIGLGTTDIRVMVARIIRTALGLLGIVALVLMLYAGFVWMTAGGDDEKISQAKKILLNSVIGLAIILSSYAITSFVISSLVAATTEDGGAGGPGGGGGDNPYFPVGIFYVDSLPSGGQMCIRNVHLTLTFNKEVDVATLNGNVVVQAADGAEQAGEWQVLSNTTVAFVPNGDCGGGAADCFAASTAYTLHFKNGSAVKTSDGQMSLNCVIKAGCADVQFTTGEGVDRLPPQVKIESIASDLLRAGNVVPVVVSYTDDNGVQKIDLSADNYFVGSQTVAGCQKIGSVTVNWPTVGIAGGPHTLQAIGYDWSALNYSTSTNVSLLPQHCFDNVLDSGEVAIGPPACGGDCGACAGGPCTGNAQCASGYCDPTAGVCVDKMRINGVSPLSGGPGTFVSIAGNYFGNTPGKVFIGDVQAQLADCSVGAWKSWQIIIEVPPGAISGPISVETASDAAGNKFTDATNDNFGPAISNFTVNTDVRPGLCSINPASALPGTEVSLIGDRFGIAVDDVFFGQQNVPITPGNWANFLIKARVPLLDAGPVGVKVTRNNLDSNSVRFFVEQGLSGTAPVISNITPDHGAKGEYITITGNNFGDQTGRVLFKISDGGLPTGDFIDGEFNFPAGCQNTWTDKQIIVKFPANGSVVAGQAYFVQVRPADASLGTSPVGPIFNSETGLPKPGVCNINPSSGPVPFPAGAPDMTITGENFGPSPKVYFWTSAASATSTAGRVLASTAVITNLSVGQSIATRPPLGAQTGPVVVSRLSDNKISNPQNFSVVDCVKNNNTCPDAGSHCCAVGVEAGMCKAATELCEGQTLSAGFIWRFSTKDIPKIPRVVERCNDITDLGQNLPTPSPSAQWDVSTSGVHHNVCRSASVVVEFNLPTINPISRANLVVNECDDEASTAERTCTVAQEVPLSGAGDFVPQLSTENNKYLELNLADSYNAGKWIDNTWYQVVLKDGITAGVGTSTAPLAKDKSCGAGTAYCFVFRSDSQDCKMKQVVITPYSYFTSILEAPIKHRNSPLDPGGEAVSYTGHGLSTQRCIIMDTDAFTWSWGTKNIDYANIFSPAPPTIGSSAEVSAVANTVGVGLTNPDNAVNITATATFASASFTGNSPLTIDLNNPQVVDFWPTCLQSCTNAEVGVRFNTTMSEYQNLQGGPVKLLKCNDENCFDTESVLVPADVILDSASDYRILKIANTGAGSAELEPNSIYQVILSASTTNVNSPELLWSAAVLGDPTTHSKPYNKQFTWRFKTKTEKCKISRVDVLPQNYFAEFINDKVLYSAQPYSSPDACSAQGQKLNPWTVSWNWESSEPLVADVKTFSTKGNNPYCTLDCVLKGSTIPVSFTAGVPICGNGVVEAGEDCDSPNTGAGCGLDCRRLGNASASSVGIDNCGNGIIEPNAGETCDTGSPTSSIGCSRICLRSGSTPITDASATGASICGNGFIGSGEDCDLGISSSSTISISSMRCSENCLHKGTRLSNKWCSDNNAAPYLGFTSTSFRTACRNAVSRCGDGIANLDEDPGCDLGAGVKASWCNDFCLSNTSTHADAGYVDGAEGYDQNGQHLGSSLLYTASSTAPSIAPSLCGDGVAGIGEDAFCETLLPDTHSGNNPWSLVTGKGLWVATGIPPAQQTDISANTTEQTVGGAVSDKGQFTIACGYKTDAECQTRMGEGWGVAANGCCYERPKLLSVYPGSTSSAQSNICPNTVIEATFDQEINLSSLSNNIVVARGIGTGIGGVQPTAPTMVATIFESSIPAPDFKRVRVLGNYAYVAAGAAGFKIFDITTPSSPTEIGSVSLYGLISYDVWVADGYAYVAASDAGFPANNLLRVIDVSNPHAPVERSFLSFDGGMSGALQAVGNYIYIAAQNSGIKIVNVSDKINPALDGGYTSLTLTNASGITIRGSLLYVANGSGGDVQIFNISNPTTPVFLGKVVVGGTVSEVVLSGANAYVAAGSAGLKIVNISSSTNPVQVGSYGSNISGVAVASGYVFLAKGAGGLEIIDASDPANVVSKGALGAAAKTLTVSGNYVFMTAGNTVHIVDVSFLTVFNCAATEDVTSLVSATTASDYNNLPWYKKIIVAVVDFFKNLVGQNAAAVRTEIQSVKWCAGEDLGHADVVVTNSTSAKITFKLSKPLAFDTDYFVALKDGLRSKQGISIGKKTNGKPFSWKFITGSRMCEIDSAAVEPTQVYLNKVGATSTLIARAFNVNNAQVQPIPGYYAWEYLWQPAVNPYVNLEITTSSENTISAQNRNGEIDVRASAVITDNIYSGQLGSIATGKSRVIVFLCENPWPPKDLFLGDTGPFVIFPYEDKVANNDGYNLSADTFDNTAIPPSPSGGYFNFRSYYCADSGSFGKADDLPYLRPAVQVSAAIVSDSPTSSLKRFIFTSATNNDAIGMQVFSNPKHLTVSQWFELDRALGGQGFLGQMQTTKIDGYDALTDGNNIYVDALNYSSASNNLYSNIYLFSINANAQASTKKVFEQIIGNLRFNTNLTNYGYCGIDMANPGASTTCQTDLDCSSAEVCSVQTDKLKRNYRRLRDLNTIQNLLGY